MFRWYGRPSLVKILDQGEQSQIIEKRFIGKENIYMLIFW